MKHMLLVIFGLFIFTRLFSQVEKISTQEISNQIDIVGLDSALQSFHSWPHFPVYYIDPSLFQKIIRNPDCFKPKNMHFFQDAANNIQDSILSEKLYIIFKEDCLNLKKIAIESNLKKVYSINEGYLNLLIKQNNKLTEELLLIEYSFWSNAVEKAKQYSGFKRFLQGLEGNGILGKSSYNCMIIQLGLQAINSKYYSKELLELHEKQVAVHRRNHKLGDNYYRYEYEERDTSTIVLNNEYNNLKELNFEDEPELVKIIVGYSHDKDCWLSLIYNNKIGILDKGCQYAPLAGHGQRIKLELITKTRLRLTLLESWIS